MGKYLITVNEDKKCHFVLKSGNGEIILTSQLYASTKTAKRGILSVANNALHAEVEDLTKGEKKRNPKFQVYEDKGGKLRFRLIAKNGQNIGHSEGYNDNRGLKNGIEAVQKNSDSPVEVVKK